MSLPAPATPFDQRMRYQVIKSRTRAAIKFLGKRHVLAKPAKRRV